MRKWYNLLITAACSVVLARASAQTTRMLISIDNTRLQPTVLQRGDRTVVSFNNAEIDNIFARYTIGKFQQAYPSAPESYLKNIWVVEVSSPKLLEDLKNYNADLFPYAKIENEATTLYSPNDYGYPGVGTGQTDLDLIRAKDAWDITKGDSSVLIGITDTYFDTTNPDLISKFARIRYNGGAPDKHGVMVATIAAGRTDNNAGFASIGYNCKMDISGNMYDDEMLQMSADGVPVINGSWFNNCSYDVIQQGVYTSIYENGTVSCFSAGNGSSTCGAANAYAFPGAYDHNICVTSVGSQFPVGTYNYNYGGTVTGWSWNDVHNRVIGFPATDYSHYDKVDICAPGHGVSSGTLSPANPNGFQAYNAWGTSFATPFVSGTAALMISANKALSPYQIEYILKKTAAKIDTIPQNLAYAGMLGSGRLDAGSAVAMASSLNVNDPATASMFVAGIDITTTCTPAALPNGTLPKLKPTVVNGTAPFTYNWEAIPGNAAQLNNYSAEQPNVVSLISGNVLWYRLTVYDNSPVQKVASKIIKVTLTNTGNYDLSIRDSYHDNYDAINLQDSLDNRNWNLWRSPDIWNRQQNDTITLHQPANYAAANNYINVRVHNTGCQASPVTTGNSRQKLRLYWSFPSTSHNWTTDFNSSFTYTNAGNATIACGGEITTTPIDIPVIQPGKDTVIRLAWHPVNYAIAAPKAQEGNLSLLARISTYGNNGVDQGPGITETTRTPVNMRNSNNLAINNLVKVSIDSNTLVNSTAFYLVNPYTSSTTMNFNLNAMKDVYKYMSGDFKSLMTIRVYLGNLYARWVSGGRQGKYLGYDDNLKYVSFTDVSNASLKNIQMNANEHVFTVIEIGVKTLPFVNLPANLNEFMLTQYNATTNERIGSIDFEVYYNSAVNSPAIYKGGDDSETPTAVANVEQGNGKLGVYPNPVNTGTIYAVFSGNKAIDNTTVTVMDVTGRTIFTQNASRLEPRQPMAIPVDNIANGVYYLRVTGKQQTFAPVKFVVTR
ncbi:S8 family peptidase [Taibaiella soli]|uniref:Peptidase S8/S53 domain-containing protein n=1 Tax=Taibaiella soli TaxID=1649169 RepID=A0A2W2B1T6_9BACT|nr:S8 family peptidase [Taibaiella soli]PZF73978.1 hypothetical protein DN068_06470 [Taibaiella soli]